ncbi:hypothetical protein G3N59_10515 [Paraburkholderia sp. Ac-20340]|nr:hypothetical protein [Paraburkholderia sp. Ac-20340]MBN3853813.1 hypothetical protein [Paraburkholderia sp. Ac-20340]
MNQPQQTDVERMLADQPEPVASPDVTPLICLSCGAVKVPGVSLPCGH